MEELLKQKNLMIKTVFFTGLQFAALLSCLSVTWVASVSFLRVLFYNKKISEITFNLK